MVALGGNATVSGYLVDCNGDQVFVDANLPPTTTLSPPSVNPALINPSPTHPDFTFNVTATAESFAYALMSAYSLTQWPVAACGATIWTSGNVINIGTGGDPLTYTSGTTKGLKTGMAPTANCQPVPVGTVMALGAVDVS